MPETFRIGKSPIHGKGMFAARPIGRGETIGVSLEREDDGSLRQTILSRFTNHSSSPNMVNVRSGDLFELVALRDIPEGEELLADYAAFATTVAPEKVPDMSTAFKRRRSPRERQEIVERRQEEMRRQRRIEREISERRPSEDPSGWTQLDRLMRDGALLPFSKRAQDPHIRVIGRFGPLTVHEVDGSVVRRGSPEFTNIGNHFDFPFIPAGEIWIDRESQPDEMPFFIQHALVEHRLRESGLSHDKALELADRAERAERARAMGRRRSDMPVEHPKLRQIAKVGSIAVWLVDGKAIRDTLYTDFTEGGHGLVYGWIPKGEIWIDNDVQPGERGFVVIHELLEMRLMARGLPYAKAHALASKAEWMRRRKAMSKEAKDHAYVGKRKEDSGNITYLYDKKHIAARNRKKEQRLKRLNGALKKMRTKVRKDLTAEDEKTRLSALAIALIDETYERVGNEESASELKHYGVTGWMLKHVTLGKGKATIKYVGKAGVKQSKEVKDKAVLKALRRACEGKKKGDRVLDGITAKDVNSYLTPFKVTAKDIRGYHANKEMLRSLKENGGGKLPKEGKEREKALKERFKKALTDAAKKVGHEPGTLKNQYLIPRIEQYYMEGKSVKGILASLQPLMVKQAAMMDIPPKMVEDATAWVLQAHAQLCLALHRPPPPAGEVEGDLAALKALAGEAKTDITALRAASWDDIPKVEESMLSRWDGRKVWLRLSRTDGVPQGILFITRRIQPGYWAYGLNVQGWRKSPPMVPGMAPGSGYMLATALSKLVEKIVELTQYQMPPTAKDYQRHEELETALREAAAGAPPLDILQMDSSFSQEKEMPVDISGWKYENLVTSGLPWGNYTLEVLAQPPGDAAASYSQHYPAAGENPERFPRITVYAGRLLRPWSAAILKMEQESLRQNVRHEMVHLAQDLLKGALRLKMVAGLPPMATRDSRLSPSGEAWALSTKKRRKLRKQQPGTYTATRGLQLKHPLRDIEFQSNLRDSIEDWRKWAADMTPVQRNQFLRFWIKGDQEGHMKAKLPSTPYGASKVFQILYEEARNDRAKKDRWAAAVRLMVSSVRDMLEEESSAKRAQVSWDSRPPLSKRAEPAYLDGKTPGAPPG